MLHSFYATYSEGHIALPTNEDIPEGARLLITVLSDNRHKEFVMMSESALNKVWDNEEDNVYEQLLKK